MMFDISAQIVFQRPEQTDVIAGLFYSGEKIWVGPASAGTAAKWSWRTVADHAAVDGRF